MLIRIPTSSVKRWVNCSLEQSATTAYVLPASQFSDHRHRPTRPAIFKVIPLPYVDDQSRTEAGDTVAAIVADAAIDYAVRSDLQQLACELLRLGVIHR